MLSNDKKKGTTNLEAKKEEAKLFSFEFMTTDDGDENVNDGRFIIDWIDNILIELNATESICGKYFGANDE